MGSKHVSWDDAVRNIYMCVTERDPVSIVTMGARHLSARIGFDASWFGWANLSANHTKVNASHTQNLPSAFGKVWSTMSDQDLLARELRERRCRIGTYQKDQKTNSDGMLNLCDQFNIDQMVCSMHFRKYRRTSFFLSGYRSGRHSKPWTKGDLEYIRSIVSHVECAARLAHRLNNCSDAETSIMTDSSGNIIFGFEALSDNSFNHQSIFQKDKLNDSVMEKIGNLGQASVRHKGICISLRSGPDMMGLRSLQVRKIRSEDALTPREAEVCGLLANGKTAKEISIMLGTSHVTVRNQTQSIYAKLGVGRRADLARLIGLP